MVKAFLLTNTVKTFLLIVLTSFVLSLVTTLVYIKLPPFYIYSFNYSVVPTVEKTDTTFNYNNFYYGEYSKNLVSSLSLFASSSDFKQALTHQSKINILYLLSKTNGSNLINLKLVTLNKIDLPKTDGVLKTTLQKSLDYFVAKDISYNLNSMPEFNNYYMGGISTIQFFTVVFGSLLIIFSLISLLKGYYAK